MKTLVLALALIALAPTLADADCRWNGYDRVWVCGRSWHHDDYRPHRGRRDHWERHW